VRNHSLFAEGVEVEGVEAGALLLPDEAAALLSEEFPALVLSPEDSEDSDDFAPLFDPPLAA
jgi:hypothetical protein